MHDRSLNDAVIKMRDCLRTLAPMVSLRFLCEVRVPRAAHAELMNLPYAIRAAAVR